MKKIICCFTAALFFSCLFAQDYIPAADGSSVKFSIKNFGLNVTGSFKGLKGRLSFDPGNPAACSISASVDAATVNTGNDSRDNHLRKEEYFDVKKYPLISFVSTKITSGTTGGTFFVEGKINIKGVTKIISFPFTTTREGTDYLFQGEFNLNRRDFGVGGNSLVMSDNLTVTLAVLAKRSN